MYIDINFNHPINTQDPLIALIELRRIKAEIGAKLEEEEKKLIESANKQWEDLGRPKNYHNAILKVNAPYVKKIYPEWVNDKKAEYEAAKKEAEIKGEVEEQVREIDPKKQLLMRIQVSK